MGWQLEEAWGQRFRCRKRHDPPKTHLPQYPTLLLDLWWQRHPRDIPQWLVIEFGSMQTSWHTSAIRLAVRSLTSLCCIIGKPLYGRERARSTVKLWPHKQWVGMFLGCQPYLKATASQKAPSCRTKLNFFNGSEVSQLEAPFSCPKSMALCNVAGTFFLMTDADSLEVFRHCWWTALFCCDLGLDALKGALQPLLFNKVAQRWWDGFRGAELSSGHPGWIRNAESLGGRPRSQSIDCFWDVDPSGSFTYADWSHSRAFVQCNQSTGKEGRKAFGFHKWCTKSSSK